MQIDKEKVKRNFSKSAPNYDAYADLQRQMMHKLLALISRNAEKILDVGSGTGTLASIISEKYPLSSIMGIDIAPGMVKVAESKKGKENVEFIVADGEAIPFDKAEFDLVISNAALQWMNPEIAFHQIARVLMPDGRFYFSTFGADTFYELKNSGLSIHDLPPRSRLEEILREHFSQVQITEEIIRKEYSNIFELLFYIKEIGAQNSTARRKEGLLTKKKFASMIDGYKENIQITYEIFYASCAK